MAGPERLAIPIVMGILLAAIVALTARTRRDRPERRGTAGGDRGGTVWRTVRDPTAWGVGYVLLAVAFGGAGALGFAIGNGAVAIATAFAALIVLYLGYGTYSAARSRGLTSAQAALLGGWAIGLLGIAGIALTLLVG
jgi:hypothetical protein